MAIPIIDIFAGPGGLGEGFSAFKKFKSKRKQFGIALSIEKDHYAHETLLLRSFFRQFSPKNVPPDYYEFIKGRISIDELFKRWPKQSLKAKNEAWQAELGDNGISIFSKIVDKKIRAAIRGSKNWVLIGGPPCQAYSVVGRSRRQEKILDEKKDERVGLYKQYLRILAVHSPSVFVMENVKGLLSAKTNESQIFSKILNDLTNPAKAYREEYGKAGKSPNCSGYRIFSLTVKPTKTGENGEPNFRHKDFIIESEKYGVPQTRHRLILLGIRKDLNAEPDVLVQKKEIPVSSVLFGLPKLRSSISKIEDDGNLWREEIEKIFSNKIIYDVDKKVKKEMIKQFSKITLPHKNSGGNYVPYNSYSIKYLKRWYLDTNLSGVCNHNAREHMVSDLLRYFFVSCFSIVNKRSPKLEDFPKALLPNHKNVTAGIEEQKFADRFRVQLWNIPCKTITSHISKDGHYYIHPDPTQCRSLTVREAARIQTFPDNYFFCGPRTSQYTQVGNAVPPLLANQIAGIVSKVFGTIQNHQRNKSKLKKDSSQA